VYSTALALAGSYVTVFAPDHLRAHVGGIHQALTKGAYALMSVVLSVVAVRFGLRLVLTSSGLAMLLALSGLWWFRRPALIVVRDAQMPAGP
jgi:hypothetical protein